MHTMQACLAVVTVVALTAVHSSTAATAKPCVINQNVQCLCDEVDDSVTCINVGMTSYPHPWVPAWAREVDFGFNRIRFVPLHISVNTPHLTVLRLNNNIIELVLQQTVAELVSLRTLDLSKNNITSIEWNSFATNANLTDIDLRHNKISNLPPGLFSPLTNLRNLRLSENHISTYGIHSSQFHQNVNLFMLDLGSNLMTTLPPGLFHTLANLQTLVLQFNKISHLDSSIFGKLRRLRRLYLGNNQLVHLPGNLFSNNPDLSELLLLHNRIESLPLHLFDSQGQLRNLDLSTNNIQAITPCLFNKATDLIHLDLTHNNIKWIPYGFLANPSNFSKFQTLGIDRSIIAGPSSSSMCALLAWAGRSLNDQVLDTVLNNLKASEKCNKVNTTSFCSKYSTCSPLSDDVMCSGYDCRGYDFFRQRQPANFVTASSACAAVNARLPGLPDKECLSQWLRKSGITQGAWLSNSDQAGIHYVGTPDGLSAAPDRSAQNVICKSVAECDGKKFFTYRGATLAAARHQCSTAGARLPSWDERSCVSRWLVQNNFWEGAWLDRILYSGAYYVANPVGFSAQFINRPVRVVCVSIDDCPLTKSNFYFHTGAATTWPKAEAKCRSYTSVMPKRQDRSCIQRFLENLKVVKSVWLDYIPHRHTESAYVQVGRTQWTDATNIYNRNAVLCKRTFGITIPLFERDVFLKLNIAKRVNVLTARTLCTYLPGIELLHLTVAQLQMISVYLIQLLKVPSVRLFMQDNSVSPPAEHVFEATASGTWNVTKTTGATAFPVCVGQ